MSTDIYILVYGEGVAIVNEAELSRLCAAGRVYYRLQRLSAKDFDHDETFDAGPALHDGIGR